MRRMIINMSLILELTRVPICKSQANILLIYSIMVMDCPSTAIRTHVCLEIQEKLIEYVVYNYKIVACISDWSD